ncbi:SLBB domain-containing protein [Spirochaetia bacterium 38H-sp]|uniref:SLBB domain-containing protein n=1 Tax=Rarispira pelagica TaxID=3141764 RepID=A0ABU9UD36_9SPIR
MKKATIIIILLLFVTASVFAISKEEVAQKIQHIKDYRPVPGDVYTLSVALGGLLNGNDIKNINIPLQQDYTMEVPFIGTVNTEGKTFYEIRRNIIDTIKQKFSIQYVDFRLTVPAVFDVGVYGAVKTPGRITAFSLMSLYEAVGAAGGPRDNASLRRIELTRDGETKTYDLLSFVAFGDEKQNPRLIPGDKIRVPIANSGVVVQGAVINPGTFELTEGDNLKTILSFAGGLAPGANSDNITIISLSQDGRYTSRAVSEKEATDTILQNGDQIIISSNTSGKGEVVIEGAFYGSQNIKPEPKKIPDTPIRFSLPYHEGLSVLEVLEVLGGPTPYADMDRAVIVRQDGTRQPVVHMDALWNTRDKSLDVQLNAGDYFVVPIKPLKVIVGGNVNNSDAFAFVAGYTVGDYIKLARGINPSTGSIDALFFVDELGNLTKVTLDTPVIEPGTMIYAGDNAWQTTTNVFNNVTTVTDFGTSLLDFASTIMDFIARF